MAQKIFTIELIIFLEEKEVARETVTAHGSSPHSAFLRGTQEELGRLVMATGLSNMAKILEVSKGIVDDLLDIPVDESCGVGAEGTFKLTHENHRLEVNWKAIRLT